MAPAVSVIIPTYNRPQLIGEAIESALAQTFDDLVVLVGDNGGSPLTEDVVRSYDDPRIQYLRRPTSIGGQANWLDLIDRAETPLVASLHDDDIWEPTYLEKTAPLLLADPSASIAFCDYWSVDSEGALLSEHTEWLTQHSTRSTLPVGRVELPKSELLRRLAVRGACQPAYAAVLRRQAVVDTDFVPEIDPLYDIWLTYKVIMRGEGLIYVPERLTRYRVWPGSLTAVGYGSQVDAVYGHVIAENGDLDDLVDAIEADWALDRFQRGWDALEEPDRREWAQRQLRRATPGLTGLKWLAAEVAGRSDLGWRAAGAARSGVRSLRARLRPDRLDLSGLPADHMEPLDEAKQLVT